MYTQDLVLLNVVVIYLQSANFFKRSIGPFYVVVKTKIVERNHTYDGEDAAHINARLINNFVSANPNSRIITILSSGVKHLVIVYETDEVQIANHQQLEQAAVEQASKLLEVAVPHGGFFT